MPQGLCGHRVMLVREPAKEDTMTTFGRGNYLGVDDALDDDEYRQSTTACCPRQTIPDSCSCLEGCTCPCLDCSCGDDGELEADDRRYCAACDAVIPWAASACPGCGGWA